MKRGTKIGIALGLTASALGVATYVALGTPFLQPEDTEEDTFECDLPAASGILNHTTITKLPPISGINSASGIAFWPDASTAEAKVFLVVDDHETANLFKVTLSTKNGQPHVETTKIQLDKEFHNPEGITYLGKSRFAVVEERRQRALVFFVGKEQNFAEARCITEPLDGGRFRELCRDNQRKGSPLHYICNAGLEGISFEGSRLYFVQEKHPKRLFYTDAAPLIDCAPEGKKREKNVSFPTLVEETWVSRSNVVSDISDILALPNQRLMLLSQECSALVEFDLEGNPFSALQLHDPELTEVEGITWDGADRIYLVSEGPGASYSPFYELVLPAGSFAKVPEPRPE